MTSQFPTRQLARLSGHNGPVHAVTYSAGLSEYILTGSADRTIRLFNASRGSLIQTYTAHGYDVLDLSVSGDNARLASVGGDKAVFVWDVAAARTLRRFQGHAGRVNAVAFGGEGDGVVVSGSYDGTVRLWDCRAGGGAGKAMMVLGEARDSVGDVVVGAGEVLAGSVDGRVRAYDLRMGVVTVDCIGHPVTSLAPTRQSDSLLVSTLDSTLRLMDRRTGRLLRAYAAPDYVNAAYRVRSTLGLNDSVVVSGSEDGTVFVWDLLDGSVRHRLRHGGERGGESAKRDVVSAVAFCRARREWVSAGGDGNVVVWGMPE